MDDAVCRVCGDSGSVEYPLYHPCKCSGSIRHVHEKCLIKWLLIKSDNSKDQVPDTPSAMSSMPPKGTKCEICGFEYQFLPVYSAQYVSATSLSCMRTKLFLWAETIKSIFTGLGMLLAFIFLTFITSFVFPFVVGATALSLWFHTLGDFYGVSSIFEHLGFVTLIGYIVLVCGTVAGNYTAAYTGDFGILHLRVWILGSFFSWSLWTMLVLIGRSLWLWMEIFSMPTLWTNFLHDFQCFLIGALVILLIIGLSVFASSINKITNEVIQSVYEFVCNYIVQTSIGALCVYLLNVDEYIMVEDFIEFLGDIFSQTYMFHYPVARSILAFFLYVTVGFLLVIPICLVNGLFNLLLWSDSFKQWVSVNEISRAVFGKFHHESKGRGSFWFVTVSVTRIVEFCSDCLVLFSVYWPSLYVLRKLEPIAVEMEPLSRILDPPPSFEFFYASVLFQLVLTVPAIPRGLSDNWTRTRAYFKTKFFAFPPEPSVKDRAKLIFKSLILRNLILYAIAVNLVGFPLVIGRFSLSPGQYIFAYPMGCLTVVAAIQIFLRVVHSMEKLKMAAGTQLNSDATTIQSVANRVVSKSITLIYVVVRCLLALFCFLVLLPLTVGGAFKVAVIMPFRDMQNSELTQVSSSAVNAVVISVPVQLMALWMIGLLLLKLAIAINVIVGSVRLRPTEIRPNGVTVVIGAPDCAAEQPFYGLIEGVEERGLFDATVQRDLIRRSLRMSIKIAVHSFGPLMVAVAMERADIFSTATRNYIPPIYLLCMMFVFGVVPEVQQYLEAKREMAFSKEFIVKRQLCNRDGDGMVLGRSGR